MKRLKEFFDLIVSFDKAWPYLSGFFLLACTVTAGLIAKIQLITVQLKIPLLIVILIASLSLYPLVKFVEWIIKKNIKAEFSYSGLLWKPSWFGFGYPTPLCPVQNCGCKIYYKVERSLSVEGNYSVSPFFEQKTKYHYIYECPKHNKINVPNVSMDELRSKANFFKLA